ncbi:uncharacterized protein [Taeniopygia guttata]|uniref:uncharacterized protein isoform X2 n=1 Tax=Taeniopygia guttata TaxID=59729 RepID=UPI003BB974D2
MYVERGQDFKGRPCYQRCQEKVGPAKAISKCLGFGNLVASWPGQVASPLGRGFLQLLEDQSWPRHGAAHGDRSSLAPVAQRRPGAPPAGSLPRVGRAADVSGGSFNFNVQRCFSSFRSVSPGSSSICRPFGLTCRGFTLFYPKYHRLLKEILSAVLARARRLAREGAVRLSLHRYSFPALYCTSFFSFARICLLHRVPHTRLSRLAQACAAGRRKHRGTPSPLPPFPHDGNSFFPSVSISSLKHTFRRANSNCLGRCLCPELWTGRDRECSGSRGFDCDHQVSSFLRPAQGILQN